MKTQNANQIKVMFKTVPKHSPKYLSIAILYTYIFANSTLRELFKVVFTKQCTRNSKTRVARDYLK